VVDKDRCFELLNKYEPRIKSQIYNPLLTTHGLVEDALQEIFIVFLERCPNVNVAEAIPFHLEFWIILGINRTLRNQYPERKPIKKDDIPDFVDRVRLLIEKHGYGKEDAERFVIEEESLRRFHFVHQVHPPRSHEGNPESHYLEWVDRFRNDFPEIKDFDGPFILEAITFCFEKLKKHGQKVFQIMADIFIAGEAQNEIARKHGVTDARIAQIKKENFPGLVSCLENQLGLEKAEGRR
jgi:hypothetical protein